MGTDLVLAVIPSPFPFMPLKTGTQIPHFFLECSFSFKNFQGKDCGDGTFKVSLELLHPSTKYALIVQLHNKDISNSPFQFETMS